MTEALEAFRMADHGGLPVGIRKHKVVQHVRERLVINRNLQIIHMCEVGGRQHAGFMVLREEHLP